MNVDEIIELAVVAARATRKYTARAVRSCHFVPTGLPKGAMSCDKYWRIYYDPSQVASMIPLEAATLVLHECDHILLRHFERAVRAGAVGTEEMNIAADCEINDDLRAEGHPFPYRMYFPEDIGAQEGLLLEEYLAILRMRERDRRPGQRPNGSGPNGDEEGRQDSDGHQGEHGGGRATAQDDSDGNSAPGEDDQVVSGGSGSDGMPRPWELGEPSPEHPGVTEEKGERIRLAVAKDIKAHGRGVSQHWGTWADATMTKSKIPWGQRISSAVRKACISAGAGRDDYSYSRRNRHQPWRQYIVPGMVRHIPNIAIVRDTSGSMSGETGILRGETEAICRHIGEAHLIDCDSAIRSQGRSSTGRGDLHGGGGTDMRVGIEAALKMTPAPDLIVVVTDGETPWPIKKPKKPVIIASTGDGGPKWAINIHVDINR